MSEREQAMHLLNSVPDYKLSYIVAYLKGASAGEDIPNAETIAAMEELENGGGTVFNGSAHDFISAMLED